MSAPPSLASLARQFARIGFLSFGGPAPQIAMLHDLAVDRQGWISDQEFLRALNVCHLLPGPEAMQLATWIGWRLGGVRGGLIAGGLFVLPGVMVIFALSALYAYAADLTLVSAAFTGVQAAVLVILASAVARLGQRTLKSAGSLAIAGGAFLALLFGLPFPAIVVLAGLAGLWLTPKAATPDQPEVVSDPEKPDQIRRSTITLLSWLALWLAPLALVFVMLGGEHRLTEITAFFSWLAIVSFGGAYAVLAFMAQAGVEQYGWLSAGEMADGLALAESTPGPLILVTQFTGFLAAFREAAPFTPLVAGLMGSLLTVWAVFAPSFMAIFTLAPWMERLNRMRTLQSALNGISSAVVGVIASLAVWFATQVMFGVTGEISFGPFRLITLDPASINLAVLAIAGVCAGLAFTLKRGVMTLVAAGLAMGLALPLAGIV
ncbi:chromate efflux transporter [Glycocaulis abyssi]|uniref:Chromate efflux transporter n=1 Tax=Glycocaulis abyssi TaxID=1433403 RepID=A0ABV9ND02_9PROT